MTKDGDNPGESLELDPQEARLGELINQFFDRRQSGEDLTEEGFLAEHSEHADALREHLVGLNLLDGIGSSSQRPTLPGEETTVATGSSAGAVGGRPPPMPEIPGYEILKLIGRGGMGLVYKAKQHSTQRSVALKLLLEGPLASDQSRRRFEREIALAAQLKHPNIIPIYDSGTCDGRMYYAMEYVRGRSLNDHLSANKPDIPTKLRLFADICDAVRHAHQRGIVHRDLKPSNVIVDADGKPHILDFGLAKASSLLDATTSITAQIVGTPAYMSPEQASGDPDAIDIRTDIYSLGVVLYEMLTGHMPYDTSGSMGKVLDNIAHAEPEPPRHHDKRIDAELAAIVVKALEKAKDDRYQSLDALTSDVARYLAGDPISVRPASGLYLLRKAFWKHRLVVGVSAALILIGASILLIVRHFSAKLDQAGTQITHVSGELERNQAESDRLKREAEAERLQREESEQIRAAILNMLDPALASNLDAITRGVTDSVRRGEDPSLAVARIMMEAAAKINIDKAETPTKDVPTDFGSLFTSRKPERLTETPPPGKTTETPEWLRILSERIVPTSLPARDSLSSTQPTSQPSTQPAGSQPSGSTPTTPASTEVAARAEPEDERS